MVKHIVIFKVDKVDKVSKLFRIKELLEELPSKIDLIRHYKVGLNISQSPQAYDIILLSEFDDLLALEQYKIHPAHLKVVDFINSVKTDSAVIDFEI